MPWRCRTDRCVSGCACRPPATRRRCASSRHASGRAGRASTRRARPRGVDGPGPPRTLVAWSRPCRTSSPRRRIRTRPWTVIRQDGPVSSGSGPAPERRRKDDPVSDMLQLEDKGPQWLAFGRWTSGPKRTFRLRSSLVADAGSRQRRRRMSVASKADGGSTPGRRNLDWAGNLPDVAPDRTRKSRSGSVAIH